MMAAALAAAEAALAERESVGNGSVHHAQQTRQEQLQQSEEGMVSLLSAQERQFQHEERSAAQHLLNRKMESVDANAEDVQAVLQMMLQHQEQQKMKDALEAKVPPKPTKHYMTIAQDGTILEATETVTGFPPNSLLMTSWFDSVYDDDLPGFVAIKTQFWDEAQPGVQAYLRRRTIDGDWVWLAVQVVQYVDDPVPGVIVEEELVQDTEKACKINRITRISAILMQAIETAKTEALRKKAVLNDIQNGMSDSQMESVVGQEIPLVAEDAQAFQSWLRQASGQSGMDLSNAAYPLRNIMMAAAAGGQLKKDEPEKESDDPIARLQNELMNGRTEERKGFDPMSALKAVRGEGTRLDLGMSLLSPVEVKLITLVLTGRIQVHELAPIVAGSMSTPGCTLSTVLDLFKTDSELQALNYAQASIPEPEPQVPRSGSGKRRKGPMTGTRLSGSGRSYQNQSFVQNYNNASHQPPPRQQAPQPKQTPLHDQPKALSPAPITVVNLSYTFLGNAGIEMLGEILYLENSELETLDISFCGLDERGLLAFSRALTKRKRRELPPLKGLIISGNVITYRAAKELGMALSPSKDRSKSRKRKTFKSGGGYDEDSESDDEDFDDEDNDGDLFSPSETKRLTKMGASRDDKYCSTNYGLQVFHAGAASLTPDAMYQLLCGLGVHCPVQELNLTSNDLGPKGATMLVDFLEQKNVAKHPVMPYLDRLDLSNNNLGNDGTARLTRAISKRSQAHFKDLRLSCNDIGPGGIETIMNKLLQHSIVSLSLDKNSIGDQGCQLVAASLQSMHQLSRLNLSFNQIGSRGVNTLMRTLVGCESITYLGLSGNIMKLSGAIAMGFTLAQHPRLEELDLDNCCLSQSAQCHIVAGIISNRWVPMKYLNGFQAGPPMAAIGALDVFAHNLSNNECFRIRRDEQMKTILQWMESNRAARQSRQDAMDTGGHGDSQQQYLTPDFVSEMNEVQGTPSQNSYLRMLGWLSRIPFDEDELTSLRKYFYDSDGGEGDRGSDGYINLKLRGDLLAALDSGVADEIRDTTLWLNFRYIGSVGMDLAETSNDVSTTEWDVLHGNKADKPPSYRVEMIEDDANEDGSNEEMKNEPDKLPSNIAMDISTNHKKHTTSELSMNGRASHITEGRRSPSLRSVVTSRNSLSSLSKQSLSGTDSDRSMRSSYSVNGERRSRVKPRITMFPTFETKLEELKATAKDMMDQEEEPEQQDVILTQYAEASLTILRQLRYHCMNSGLDGWRQGKLKRKVLIVDDSRVTRKLVSRAFEKANFIVDTAENGVEGVKKMKEAIYDIAFMDIDMPVMNGFEATKALRQWEDKQRPGARQPICALTAAYVDDFEKSELMKFKEAGLDVMESKPCNIPRLFKVVDDVSPMFSDLSISVSQSSLA